MKEFIIDETGAEMRLDRFLRREIPGLTQGVLQKLLRTGKVRLNGARAEANARLTAGDTLTAPEIEPEQKPRARQVVKMDPVRQKELEAMVLYRDASLLVLNKPAGLAVQGGSGITVHIDGMLDALQGDAPERPKLVHRIDRDTSGLLIIARSGRAAKFLTAAFRGRDVEKTYWALLAGVPELLEGRIDLPLKRIDLGTTSRAEPASRKDKEAQKAITDYRVLDRAGKRFCLVELKPHTGRMHQLRAHCLALGTPILGDAVYGGIFSEHFAQQLHLHARRLVIAHPEGGLLSIEAPLPKHMRDGLAYLGFSTPEAEPAKRGR
ncbi:RluA family pseudouridine synthase [Acidocella sp. KAb 2-4]|uniref:RluA family pseudouridine synthase n=1 Tax=Acidocella sp. KAb 2-4 TaxID=2885158 RepID=UPI001D061905|nr:RluA family pseudouridine synthase [Acidocella sp. KAb 2-4]MCB5945254.1 RluA family pseudouridine synthase [Acidocella sp. KAb 2-4]